MSGRFVPLPWTHDTNIYEVNLRQYTKEGTFRAFTGELPRLREMGVEVLWFMPIQPIGREKRIGSLGSYYACSDYTAVNPEFGTLEDFKDLVREAHEQGMKVLMDWVANHTAWDHRWTWEYPDFYKKNDQGAFYDSNGWTDVIDLNYANPVLRSAMKQAMAYWINQCDIDGFRCDMAMLVPLDFWKEARRELDYIKKLFWLAECEEPTYHQAFDASYTWKFLHKMEAYWKKETDMKGLEQVLAEYDSHFPSSGYRVYFTTNHDENSHSGSEFERMGDAAIPFAVFCATWKGLPMIYSGQELPNLKRLNFFDKDQIDWDGEYKWKDFFRSLLTLRKRKKAMRAGDPSVTTTRLHTGADDRVLAYLRASDKDQVLVILNLSAEALSVELSDAQISGRYQNIFSGDIFDEAQGLSMHLAPWDYRVFEK